MPSPEQKPQTYGDQLKQFEQTDQEFTRIIEQLQQLQKQERGNVAGALMNSAAQHNPELIEALGQALNAIINNASNVQEVINARPQLNTTILPPVFSLGGKTPEISGTIFDSNDILLLPHRIVDEIPQSSTESQHLEENPRRVIEDLYTEHPLIETLMKNPTFQEEKNGKRYVAVSLIEVLMVHKSKITDPELRYQYFRTSLISWLDNTNILHTLQNYRQNVKFLTLDQAASLILFLDNKSNQKKIAYTLRNDTMDETDELKKALGKLQSKKKY